MGKLLLDEPLSISSIKYIRCDVRTTIIIWWLAINVGLNTGMVMKLFIFWYPVERMPERSEVNFGILSDFCQSSNLWKTGKRQNLLTNIFVLLFADIETMHFAGQTGRYFFIMYSFLCFDNKSWRKVNRLRIEDTGTGQQTNWSKYCLNIGSLWNYT